jgi:hypothetical protein
MKHGTWRSRGSHRSSALPGCELVPGCQGFLVSANQSSSVTEEKAKAAEESDWMGETGRLKDVTSDC